jgi:hypothetical protein
METIKTQTYITNYNTLKDTVSQIQSMTEPDVDLLVPLVERATQARSVCLSRIEAVEQLLGLEPVSE